jgi:hypothetical protein
MPPSAITFELVRGVQRRAGRGVGVLGGDKDLCRDVLYGLPEKEWDYIRASMDIWTQNINTPAKRFHGFDGKYDDCFVFKHVAKKHRFYGFLCNPEPKTNPGFRLCVLTTYARKKEWETDYAELDRVHQWRNAPATKTAISYVFPEYKEVKPR